MKINMLTWLAWSTWPHAAQHGPTQPMQPNVANPTPMVSTWHSWQLTRLTTGVVGNQHGHIGCQPRWLQVGLLLAEANKWPRACHTCVVCLFGCCGKRCPKGRVTWALYFCNLILNASICTHGVLGGLVHAPPCVCICMHAHGGVHIKFSKTWCVQTDKSNIKPWGHSARVTPP